MKTINKSDKLRQWLADHPSIAPTRMEQEAGIPKWSLSNLKRPVDLPEKHWPSLLPVLEKYGWK